MNRSTAYEYDALNRMTASEPPAGSNKRMTFTYNRLGHTVSTTDFMGRTTTMTYNHLGRLTSTTDGVGTISYASGKRRVKAVGADTTYWRWDTGYSVLAEYTDQTPDWAISGLSRLFVPFGHTAFAEAAVDASGNPANAAYTYLAHDHLGTGRYGFNHAKTEQFNYEHLPYGQRHSTSGPALYHEFTGKPWDPDLQMYYFPYRYYSPGLNRWTMADPAGLIDGPNVYAYGGGNPVSFIDMYGLNACYFKCDVTLNMCASAVGAGLALCMKACFALVHPLAVAACATACTVRAAASLAVCQREHRACIKRCDTQDDNECPTPPPPPPTPTPPPDDDYIIWA